MVGLSSVPVVKQGGAHLDLPATGSLPATCKNSALTQAHAGRLKHFYDCWLGITKNPIILDWIIRGYRIPFAKKTVQADLPRNCFSVKEKQDMTLAINNLLELGA